MFVPAVRDPPRGGWRKLQCFQPFTVGPKLQISANKRHSFQIFATKRLMSRYLGGSARGICGAVLNHGSIIRHEAKIACKPGGGSISLWNQVLGVARPADRLDIVEIVGGARVRIDSGPYKNVGTIPRRPLAYNHPCSTFSGLALKRHARPRG